MTTINEQTIADLMIHDAEAFIEEVYALLLGRIPDAVGESYYLERLRSGKSKKHILLQVSKSDESLVWQNETPSLANALAIWRKKNTSFCDKVRDRNPIQKLRQLSRNASKVGPKGRRLENEVIALTESHARLAGELGSIRTLIENISANSQSDLRFDQKSLEEMSWQARVVHAQLMQPSPISENACE